ncbi:MAG TPA: radical SAM protein [Candidatus Binataceae bacterium]|nr:radical SAM protein [Candidatus Binataceae bacterium]
MARIALINPRFEVSYWGLERVMPITGKRATMPVSALPLLAALVPESDSITLIDENVEEIDYAVLEQMDIVGVTGMIVQRFRMKEILAELKRRGKFVIVGGAWVTVQEHYFDGLADAIFVGEADESWPAFLNDWKDGRPQKRYEQITKTDMSKLPTPRFDLLKVDRYQSGSMQISRGCPFLCEFCDIIVTFGRRPRLKTIEQVIAELDAFRALGILSVFIVDDNFIGNKQAVKVLLRDIVKYQQGNGYPFRFFTEASLDLAEDDELMELMTEANINAVFVGIESPNEDSLRETRKNQNIRPKAGTMLERIRKIQRAGMEVWCGMIVGFDSDDETIFEAQLQFLGQSSIPHIMMGMLHAFPGTPLHLRLAKEGRLDPSDTPQFGTNVIPLRLSREDLQRGYLRVMRALNLPDAYFARLDDLYLRGGLKRENLGRAKFWRRHPLRKLKDQALNCVRSVVLFRRLMKHVDYKDLRREYRRRIWRATTTTSDPGVALTYIIKCAVHYHHHRLIEDMEREAAQSLALVGSRVSA